MYKRWGNNKNRIMKKSLILLIILLLNLSANAKTEFDISKELSQEGYSDINVYESGYISAQRYGKPVVFYFDPKVGNDNYSLIIKAGMYNNVQYDKERLFAEKNGMTDIYVNGKKINNSPIETIDRISNDKRAYKQNGKWGLINKSEFVVPAEFDSISILKDDYILTKKGKKFGLFKNDIKISDPMYDSITINKDKHIIVKSNEKYGIICKDKLILPAEYDSISLRPYNFVVSKNKKYGIADNTGKILLPIKYDSIKTISTGDRDWYQYYYEIKLGTKYGAYDSKVQLLVPPKYDKLEYSQSMYGDDRMFIVYLNGKRGAYADLRYQFKSVIPVSYDTIDYDRLNHIWTVSNNGKKGVYSLWNSEDIKSIPAQFNEISLLNDCFYKIKNNNKYGIYSIAKSAIVVPLIYDSIKPEKGVYENIPTYIVEQNGKLGAYSEWYCSHYTDPQWDKMYSKNIIPVEFDNIQIVPNGYIVSKNGKQGFYHIDKGEMLKPKYDKITYINGQKKLIKTQNLKISYTKIPENEYEKYRRDAEAVVNTMFFWLKDLK